VLDKVSPRAFYDCFEAVVGQRAPEIIAHWNSWVDYTWLMRGTVLREVAALLRLDYYPGDYYTLDGVMYAERDSENFPRHMTYVYSISVALEHENNPKGTLSELNKLQLFNSPLKVLITYPDRAYSAEVLLPRYAKAMLSADAFDDFSTLRRQLVIFGSKRSQVPEWRGFVYSRGVFVPVAEC
jgi:hypothetical protein